MQAGLQTCTAAASQAGTCSSTGMHQINHNQPRQPHVSNMITAGALPVRKRMYVHQTQTAVHNCSYSQRFSACCCLGSRRLLLLLALLLPWLAVLVPLLLLLLLFLLPACNCCCCCAWGLWHVQAHLWPARTTRAQQLNIMGQAQKWYPNFLSTCSGMAST